MRSTRASRGAMAGLILASATFTASAAEETLVCVGGPESLSEFEFDFNEFGGDVSQIALTEFDLRLNAANSTATLEYYYQEVASLTLPGGFETGDMVIAVVPGTSVGTYDASTGEFTTSEFYAIYFEGDLSAFGLTSPVYLPGASTGQFVYDDPILRTGATHMVWDGEGALPAPGGSGELIPFTYQCRVNTAFVTDEPCPNGACPGDLDGDCDVDLEDLSQMLNHYGEVFPGPSPRDGDVDHNGDVNLQDLATLLSAFGSDCN